MTTPSSAAVFLSYARDDVAVARRIADALRSQGIDVWFDENELRGGDAWDAKIRKQINDCALFIPIISPHTESRSKGYFRLEWKLAVDQTHLLSEGMPFLAPVVLDNIPEDSASVPPEFLWVQWMRLPSGLPTPQFVARIQQLLSAPKTPAKADRPAARPSTARPPRKNRAVAWAAVAIVALATIALVARRAWPSARARADSSPPVPAASEEKSVAVLPLANLSDDKSFFADGVHDELITDLAAIADLKVISRTSVLQYRDARTNLRDIGRQLGVNYIVEGSVRKEANRVRITAQLIDTRTDTHLWAGTFDKELPDVFVLQADLAQEIANALQARLTPAETQRIQRERGAPLDVYELAQRARTIIFSTDTTRENYAMAVDLCKRAVQREPGFAFGWATLAHVDVAMIYRGFDESRARSEEAKAAVNQALKLDPNLPEAHWALGRYYEMTGSHRDYDHDGKRALAELNLARASMPNEPRILSDISSVVYYGQGNAKQAIELQRRAVELNPEDPLAHYNFGRMFFWVGRYDDALAEFRQALRISPEFVGAACFCAEAEIRRTGDLKSAKAYIDTLPPALMDDRVVFYRFLMAYLGRDASEALRILRESPVAFFHDNVYYGPREYLEGVALRMAGDQAGAREKFVAARARLAADKGRDVGPRLRISTLIAAALGDAPSARRLLGQYEDNFKDVLSNSWTVPDLQAQVYTFLGDSDQAIDALERLVHREKTESRFSLLVNPDWDRLRDNPRFKQLTGT